jgi:hypothetical protein
MTGRYKYTVFSDGSISHYIEDDETIATAEVFNTLPPARARALALLEADCKEKLLALTKIKGVEIE